MSNILFLLAACAPVTIPGALTVREIYKVVREGLFHGYLDVGRVYFWRRR